MVLHTSDLRRRRSRAHVHFPASPPPSSPSASSDGSPSSAQAPSLLSPACLASLVQPSASDGPPAALRVLPGVLAYALLDRVATVVVCSEPTQAEIEAAALRAIERHVERLLAMPRHSLMPHEAEDLVRVAVAALAHITEPDLRRQALVGMRRCAGRHRAYLAELRAQSWLAAARLPSRCWF